MILVELLQSIVNTAVYTCGEPNDYCPLCLDQGGICPATAVTSIAAAFATQGYWVQADLLDMLTFTSMAALGPLLYVCAAIGGLLGVALGQPPRIYMWFFLGPALYGWLIDTRQEVTGVQWQVGQMQQDQREVWKQAEVGLLNTNMAKRMDLYGAGATISSTEPPNEVYASTFFVWYDSLLSGVINGLVEWTGAYSQNANPDSLATATNVGIAHWLDAGSEHEDRWFLLSNLKWDLLENITSAKLTSPSTRDAFATFMGGICGEQMTKSIDEGAFSSAARAKGQNLPATVFKKGDATSGFSDIDNSMAGLAKNLRAYEVEFNEGLRRLFSAQDDRTYYAGPTLPGTSLGYQSPTGAFDHAVLWNDAWWLTGATGGSRETIRCDTYLYTMVLAFRWEAGHIYSQIIASAPELAAYNEDAIDYFEQSKKLVRSLFYGWNIKANRSSGDPYSGVIPTEKQYKNFLLDLITVHLIKNEFALVPPAIDVRQTGTYLAKSYADGQQRTVGQKSKFGEVYSWARLMPYLQGVLLYYLAMGYPFACLLMLIPGWHKALFTWMSFWAWTKIWDVGFALVMSIERSVWAMIGNSSQAAGLNDRVFDMQQWGGVVVTPPDEHCGASVCTVWDVTLTPTGFTDTIQGFDYTNMLQNFRILDRAMTLGPSLDLDLSNSYYIYIMSALYFAVPAVTGQLVLGAKAGAAAMFTGAVNQVAGEAGRAAGSGFSNDLNQRVKANMASVGQAASAAHLQKSGLAAQALSMGNMAADSSLAGSTADAAKGGMQSLLGAAGNANQAVSNWNSALSSRLGAWGNRNSEISGIPGTVGNVAGVAAQSKAMGGGKGGPGGKTPMAMNVATGGIDALQKGFGFSSMASDGTQAASRVAAGAQAAYLDKSREASAQMAGKAVEGFRNNAMSTGLGRGEGRKQTQAQYGADMAAWNAQNSMGQRMMNGALGSVISSDAVSAGGKPRGADALGLSGAAGAEAKKAGGHFDWFGGGAFFGNANAAANNLNANYGQDAVFAAGAMPTYGQYVNAVNAEMGRMDGKVSKAQSVNDVYAEGRAKDATGLGPSVNEAGQSFAPGGAGPSSSPVVNAINNMGGGGGSSE